MAKADLNPATLDLIRKRFEDNSFFSDEFELSHHIAADLEEYLG